MKSAQKYKANIGSGGEQQNYYLCANVKSYR